MIKYNNIDLGLTQGGDLDVTNGDLGVVRDTTVLNNNGVPTNKVLATALKRDVLKRIATDPEDYLEAEMLSANLQRFRSQKVTPYLVAQMEEAITRALTIDGRMDKSDLDVVCLPVDKKTVLPFIFITIDGERINLNPGLVFDMSEGITLPS